MNQYFIVSDNKEGKLGISLNVFTTISENILNNLMESTYKDILLKSYEKKKTGVKTTLNKDKVNIDCLLVVSKDADIKTLSDDVKNRIYEQINKQTEISNVHVLTTVCLTD